MRSGRKIVNAGRAGLLVLGVALLAPIAEGAAAPYQVLYNFCSQDGCADGAYPGSSLIMDGAGNLYGTTYQGGFGQKGVVFKLAPDGTETVLYNFCSQSGCTDGANPGGGLVMDAAGNLYGTTQYGGDPSCYPGFGCGTAFKLAPDGTETVLYNFCSQSGCTDGAEPVGGLVIDAAGTLYGTTSAGGASGGGVVFKLAPDGTETVLYNFCSQSGCADGAEPWAGLVTDTAGNLYGTTVGGGDYGGGVVFMVAR